MDAGRKQPIKRASNWELGRAGEDLAADALMRDGYLIITRNFRCRYGEIDLVAEHGDDLVFVEVKTRRSVTFGLPEEAITRSKQRKLIQCAASYLDLYEYSERSWRIDVVAIQFSPTGKFLEMRIYPYAVMEEW